MLTVCCVCKRTKKQEAWGDYSIESTCESVSHGYCPECFSALMTELSESLPGWGNHCPSTGHASSSPSFATA
ncbi:MAG: hypothetical protein DSY50_04390 [Desulfobulbus sp.]|nr:MAG: hypothetical protein DSY50_04390 [Desulfobulbus sp.]RUM39290.1 MAG: hypothetical protein DSY58_00720 [Desulfobulbus sp.]